MKYLSAFPDYDDELTIPKGWFDSSSQDDPCPSITDKNKVIKIFQDYKDPANRKENGQFYPRYCAVIVNLAYQSSKYKDRLGLANLDDFKDVLKTSQTFLKNLGLGRS